MAKGGGFEREVSKRLSLWWSAGKTDNLFWRTPNSGGQATVREKKGIYSYHGHGDISYRHPSGKKLIDMFAIETKRGYNKGEFKGGKNSPSSFQVLLDAKKHVKAGMFETWLFQAEKAAKNAKAKSWLLIHRPDGRRDMVYMPFDIADLLFRIGPKRPIEEVLDHYVSVSIRFNHKIQQMRVKRLFGMRLESFLKLVQPDHVKATLTFLRNQNAKK